MKLKTIITKRMFRTWRSWQLVYEWEDIFRKVPCGIWHANAVLNPDVPYEEVIRQLKQSDIQQ